MVPKNDGARLSWPSPHLQLVWLEAQKLPRRQPPQPRVQVELQLNRPPQRGRVPGLRRRRRRRCLLCRPARAADARRRAEDGGRCRGHGCEGLLGRRDDLG
jgi:hypothetical protein